MPGEDAMNGHTRSKQSFETEISDLRNEIKEIRAREKLNPATDDIAEGERCRTLVNDIPEYLYSIKFDNGKILTTFHSPRCEEITGYLPADYVQNPYLWLEMVYEKDREKVQDFIRGLKEPLHCKSIEHRIVHKNGSVRWVVNMTTVHLDNQGSILRQSGFLIDVTERREEAEKNLLISNENRRNSLFDGLTGLYNRRGFWELGELQLRVASRINQPVLLFFVDVDKLKKTNDAFGHHAGDTLIMGLAEILKQTFRESDLIARIGGDEFTVLTMETGPDSSEQLIDRLRINIENKNRDSSDALALSVTVGGSRYNLRDSDTITDMVDRADKDMYIQKRNKYAL